MNDGRVKRYGPDEQNLEDQPSGIGFETGPGGFGSGTITLPRPFGPSEWDNSRTLFSPVEIYDAYGTVYEGFINGIPQSGRTSVTLQLSGWISTLDRIETFRATIVDRELDRWGDPSRARREALLGPYNSVKSANVETDKTSSLPALTLTLPAASVVPYSEATFDIGVGQEIESVYYDMTSLSTSGYVGQFYTALTDNAGTAVTETDMLTGTNSSMAGTMTPAISKRFVTIRMYLAGTVGAKDQSMTLRYLAVFGKTGIPKRGVAPNQGVYQSDVIAYALRFQSALSFSLGDSIEETTSVLTQVAYREDTTLRTVIENMTALGGNQNVPNEWGVYENREFFWKSPGSHGTTWYVRQDENAEPQSDGPAADRRVAGIKINFDDGSGTILSVGPPGSNSDYETTELLDNDPDNPAHRIQGAFKTETVGITNQQGAINIGINVLNGRNTLDWRGSIPVTGFVEDANGNRMPANRVRWGDRIVVSDAADTTPRPVSETSFDQGSLTNQISIGDRPDTEESLLGRLAVTTDVYR